MRSLLFILGIVLAVPLARAEDAGESTEEVVSGDLRGTIDESGTVDSGMVTPIKSTPFQSCNGKASAPIRVVYNITRGVQKATVLEGNKVVRTYKISGGRNKLEYNEFEGRVCSYTSVGEAKPKQLIRNRVSRAHNGAQMPFYVDLHTERAVGGHQGDTSGYSGGCIRQGKEDAKWLYMYVAEHSNFGDDNMISCSDVTFEIIDNTPGVAAARAKCFKSLGKADPVLVLPPPFTPQLPRPRPVLTGEPLPANKFTPTKFDKEAYKRQYKYLNKDTYPKKLPKGVNTTIDSIY